MEKASLLMKYEELLKHEDVARRQRSEVIWLKKGERNTKFFHKTANAHKRCNNIYHLLIQNELFSDPQRIDNEMVGFYVKKLYAKTVEWRPTANFGNCPTVSKEGKDLLQNRFEEQELLVWYETSAMDKALGLMV